MNDDNGGDPKIREILCELEAGYTQQGWDLPHVIVTVVRIDGRLHGTLTPILSFTPPELPGVTRAVLEVLREDHPDLVPVAVGYMLEGWATPPQPTLADAKAFRAAYPYRCVADDPNRIEMRYVMGLDSDGWYYHVGRVRGEEQKSTVVPLAKVIADQAKAGAGDAHFKALCETLALLKEGS